MTPKDVDWLMLHVWDTFEKAEVLSRTPAKRGPGFIALGDMALALADVGCADEMRKVAPRVAEQIREAVSAQRGRKGVFCPEALQVRP